MSGERPKISAFVITKNNGDKIEECIKSLLWADEVVVVDDFSTDATPEICSRYPVRFCSNAFEGFQEQKNFATNLAANDWVLKIDADERVTEVMKKSIMSLTDVDFDRYSCFEFKRLTCFWGKWIRHASLYPDYNPRLFNKKRGEWGGINPHDKFITHGETKKLEGDILHFQNWDLYTYANRTATYSNISAMEYHKRGKKVKWHHFTVRPLYTFLYRYFFRLGFVEGVRGFVISFMGAVGTFLKYSKLYELQHNMTVIKVCEEENPGEKPHCSR
jgi:glycosyltransferase involved in cell wall biosynthesis